MVKTSEEPSGGNCSNGGLKVQTGLDLNRNNILDDNEIETTDYVCIETQEPRVYSANISQSGTNDPVSEIINNDLGFNITWIRTAQGKFKGTIDQNLYLSNTIILCNNIEVIFMLSSSNEIILKNTCSINAFCDNFESLSIVIKKKCLTIYMFSLGHKCLILR